MLKTLRLPLYALFILHFAAAPAVQASHTNYDRGLYKSLLKKIYADSELGDGGDIYRIIKKALEENPSQGTSLVNRLISELEDNLDQLAFDVSEEDLRRIKRQLRNYLKRRQAAQFVSSPSRGNITPPESGKSGS